MSRGPDARSGASPFWIAAAALALAAGVVLLAPWLPIPAPDATRLEARLLPPGASGHWLGTDHLGRDVLARLLFGLRASLAVSAFGTAVAAGLGTAMGLLAGYRGGRVDDLLMRAAEVVLAFPYVLLALVLVAALGPGLRNAALAVAVVNIPFFARTVRGATLGVRSQDFVEVAKLSGYGESRILFGEILPNVLPVLLVATATTLGWMILETAGLSFLGLGAQPPHADLGSMLGDGRRFLATAPHLAMAPGLTLFALSIAVHALADALRDRLDPQRAAAEGAPQEAAAPAAEPVRGRSTEEAPLLDVAGLCVEMPGGRAVVRGVGLRIGPGEAVALVGESGSGKTQIALALLGLTPRGARVRAERLSLGGTDLSALDARGWRSLRGREIGYVPQDPAAGLDPLLSIGRQLEEAVQAHRPCRRGVARERARGLLARAQLPEPEALLGARPHELSGGMCQRVLIAMALAHDPPLLVADEPTTALDVGVQREILTLLGAAARERGRALLLISHDLGVVAELCQRVVVLRHGRVVEDATLESILDRPESPYTRSLVDCVPRLDDPGRVLRAAEAGA